MRITIATGPCFPFPSLRGGGMIRVWEALSKQFQQQGHAVTIFARESDKQLPQEILHGVNILRRGGFDQSPRTSVNLLRDFFYAWRSCRHLPDSDILITNDFWMPILVPLLEKKAGRVVVSVNRFPKYQMRLYGRAALLVPPSKALALAIKKQSPALGQKVVCIPNPYDQENFHNRSPSLRKPRSILFVGRLHPEKGLELLLRAFSLIHSTFPDSTLTIVGPSSTADGGGGASYLDLLRELAGTLPVTFQPPAFGAAELASIYRAHEIFCYPTLADQGEALPIAPLEAMACACVPVVSNNPVFDDWLEPGVNGWSFEHRNNDKPEAALASRLQYLLENPSLSAEMRERCVHTAKQFAAPAIASKFLQHFQRLIDETS